MELGLMLQLSCEREGDLKGEGEGHSGVKGEGDLERLSCLKGIGWSCGPVVAITMAC